MSRGFDPSILDTGPFDLNFVLAVFGDVVGKSAFLFFFAVPLVAASALGNRYRFECRECRLDDSFGTVLIPAVLDGLRGSVEVLLEDLLAFALFDLGSTSRRVDD